jgi:hypothetical protein
MAKKIVLNKAPMSEEEKKNRNFKIMDEHGEKLASVLIEKLSAYGCSPKALMAETYAVAKAYGALRAMSLSEGYDCQSLFDKLVPMFQEETEEMLAEMGQEENEK